MRELDKNMHVLVVDDQEPSRLLSKFCLVELGFKRIGEASDGYKAMEYVAQAHKNGDPVRLILCDHEMPEVDGFSFYKTLRASKECKDVTFVMVTSHSEPELVADMKNRGVQYFIVKPINSKVLGQKLVQFLLKD
jgi:CheY-like chemotaxis protein